MRLEPLGATFIPKRETKDMDRQKQIELMQGAEERVATYVRRWVQASPELKALLHRRDSDGCIRHTVVRKAVACGGE